MDTYPVCSLAQIRILLLPVGGIEPGKFDEYAKEIRKIQSIQLDDIPADNKEERVRFMPNSASLAHGHLHIAYPSHPPPHAHYPLSLIQPSHFPMAVIGVASSANTDSLNSILANFNTSLMDLFPPSALFPLARACFVFEESEDCTNLSTGHDLGLVVIPSIMGNKSVYINTRIADLCAQILGEFGVLVQNLESPQGNEYLNSSLLPTLPSLSDLPTPLDPESRRDSLAAHHSQQDLSKPTFTLGATPVMKKNSSASTFRQSTFGPASAANKRHSGMGVSSSPARLFKIYADFYLLAGRTVDAEQWYSESLSVFRTIYDPIWQASATESLSVIPLVDAWIAFQTSNNESPLKEPWLDTADKLSATMALYTKVPSDGEQDYALLSLLYCHCVIRQANLLFSIWSAKGWGPLALTSMLHSGPSHYMAPTLQNISDSAIERLSYISTISKSSISHVLSQVHGPWLLHLDPRERISILEATASIYSSLRYRRKEAYILREVLGCILDLLVCGREEDGLQRNSSQSGIQSPGGAASNGQIGIRFSESGEGNSSIIAVLKRLCRTLGLDLDAVALVDSEDKVSDPVSPASWYDEELTEGSRGVHGWPELQIGVIREAVAVAEALPDYPSVAQFSLSALKTLQRILTTSDQHHFYTTAARSLLTTQRRGITKSVSYWSGRPVVSIALSPLQPILQVVEKPKSALHLKSDVAPILMGGTDPFLYNPRKTSSQGSSLIIQNESLEFEVILQNPFAFDLELQSLSLSTAGVKCESPSVRVVIPGNSYHNILLTGCALETGILTVRGCIVQLPGGQSQEFVLPLATEAEEERLVRKKESLACESDRFKYSGLNCLPWNIPRERTSGVPSVPIAFQYLECKVIPVQPLMRIRRTSITHGAVMLYDGEISTLMLVFENISTFPVDFIRLAFDDSTISIAQQALADGDLGVFDTYETEYELIHRPLFSSESESALEVMPGQKIALKVQCLGKVGCTTGTVYVSYGLVDRAKYGLEASEEHFHIRQLVYPVMVTVYQMLECRNMNMMPLSEQLTLVEEKYADVSDENWCLFSVEIQNLYGQPFEVRFDQDTNEHSEFDSSSTIPPGATTRIIFPIPKFRLSIEEINQPIPTLSDRQFVVTKSKLSPAEESLQRELFWYREELLKRVRGRWKEVAGSRHGDLSLRQQRLTLPMLNIIKTPVVQMIASLGQTATNQSYKQISTNKYAIPSHQFIHFNVKVTNTSPGTSLQLCLDVRITPIEHIIYQGVLANQPLGSVASGDSTEHEITLCFLASGTFRISSQVRLVEVEGAESIVGSHFMSCVVAIDNQDQE